MWLILQNSVFSLGRRLDLQKDPVGCYLSNLIWWKESQSQPSLNALETTQSHVCGSMRLRNQTTQSWSVLLERAVSVQTTRQDRAAEEHLLRTNEAQSGGTLKMYVSGFSWFPWDWELGIAVTSRGTCVTPSGWEFPLVLPSWWLQGVTRLCCASVSSAVKRSSGLYILMKLRAL